MRLLVTGGAGFIGSAFVRMMLCGSRASQVVVLDKLTYAGNLENVEPVAQDPRFRFVRETRTVAAGDSLTLRLAPGGGEAIRFKAL